jgi:hypothetical protein
MAATIKRLVPVTRNQGVPVQGMIQAGMWIDSLVLAAGVAQAYTLPTDAAGNKGTMLRITANGGPIYVNFAGTAAVPAGVTNGTSSIMLRTDLGPCLLAIPDGINPSMSVISPGAAIATIEVWN